MAKRCYTFSVYLTADEPSDDPDSVDGWSEKDITRLLADTLSYYAAPLSKERRTVAKDYELMSSEEVLR